MTTVSVNYREGPHLGGKSKIDRNNGVHIIRHFRVEQRASHDPKNGACDRRPTLFFFSALPCGPDDFIREYVLSFSPLLLRHFKLDCASSGREEAFLATLDAEWASLDTHAGDGSELRSPFLVCTDRHPHVIQGLEVPLRGVRPQLVYSRGDTACLVAGIRLEDVDAVMAAEGVHAIEPLPHPAKLSRNLYATLDPLDQRRESPLEGTKPPHTGKAAEQNVSDPRHFSPLEVRFNHGKDLPTDLVISLTPGAWEPRLVRTWRQHLTSFVSTRSLWDEHLRELFLWTRSAPENFVANGASRRQGGLRAGRNVSDEANSNNSTLIAAHGLSGTASLWEVVAARSSEDGACDLGRLAAFRENDRRDSAQRGRQGPLRVGVGRSGRKKVVPRDGEMRDRLVLRGAGLLGKTAGDNVHCLLTVLAYLATRPEVAYVDDLPKVTPFNLEAAWITQSGRETSYPMWDHGLDGRTEVRPQCYHTRWRVNPKLLSAVKEGGGFI